MHALKEKQLDNWWSRKDQIHKIVANETTDSGSQIQQAWRKPLTVKETGISKNKQLFKYLFCFNNAIFT